MTAPTRTRPTRATRGRSDTALERRRAARLAAATVEAPPAPAAKPVRQTSGRTRSAAAQRAYARRAHREGRPVERVEHDEEHGAGRASFVILIIVLLTVGVAATLWLSTQAISDSYRLEDAKQTADQLAERADQLQRDVTKAESASALAERAKAMGMVPAGDPARLVVQPDGRVVVVGEPSRAEKPKPPKPPATSESTAGHPAAGQPASGQQPPAGQDQQPQRQAGNAPGAG
jgi:hypothetical protein